VPVEEDERSLLDEISRERAHRMFVTALEKDEALVFRDHARSWVTGPEMKDQTIGSLHSLLLMVSLIALSGVSAHAKKNDPPGVCETSMLQGVLSHTEVMLLATATVLRYQRSPACDS
jgi:hypothetical protein